jgi:hypothetical protein
MSNYKLAFTLDTLKADKPDSVYVLITRGDKPPAEFIFDFSQDIKPWDAKTLAVYHQAGLRTIQRESRRSIRQRARGAIGFAFKQAQATRKSKSV